VEGGARAQGQVRVLGKVSLRFERDVSLKAQKGKVVSGKPAASRPRNLGLNRERGGEDHSAGKGGQEPAILMRNPSRGKH